MDDDFREPIGDLFPPRFNPFARWNQRNQASERRRHLAHQRRQYSIRNRKSYMQWIMSYAKRFYLTIKSTKLSSFYEYVPFYWQRATLESKYKHISLAILNNSINL